MKTRILAPRMMAVTVASMGVLALAACNKPAEAPAPAEPAAPAATSAMAPAESGSMVGGVSFAPSPATSGGLEEVISRWIKCSLATAAWGSTKG